MGKVGTLVAVLPVVADGEGDVVDDDDEGTGRLRTGLQYFRRG